MSKRPYHQKEPGMMKVRYAINIENNMLEEIEDVSQTLELPRSKVTRALLRYGLDNITTKQMQSMYDYGNNTAQFLQNAMSAINTAKQSNEWYSAEQMQQATSQIMSSSAQQISNLNQQSSQQSSSTTRGNEKGISGEGHGDIEWNPGHTARNR